MATIHDVARAAGVAPSTVSYVISGKRAVSPATRRRVQQQIRLLGYRPRASGLTRRSNLLALLAPHRPGVDAPTVMRFTSAATAAASSLGLDLLLAVEMVVDQLAGTVAPSVRLLPPRLAVRASTGSASISD